MTVRSRIALSAATAVAVAVLLASLGAYFGVKSNLIEQIDDSLKQRAETVQRAQEGGPLDKPVPPNQFPELPDPGPGRFGGATGYVQIVFRNGSSKEIAEGNNRLPITEQTQAVADGQRQSLISEATVDGERLRIYTAQLGELGAVQIARPLDEVEQTLSDLLQILLLVALGGIGLAAALGATTAHTSLKPIRQFADETETIANQHAIGRRIRTETDDEIGRLASSFNTTLDQLEQSVNTQKQLVADASHELRTPLASIKTNIQLLQRNRDLPDQMRTELLHDVVEQVDELTTLASDIVELARRGEAIDNTAVELDLEEIVAAAVQRADRHWGSITFQTQLEPFTVRGIAERLDRAIYNLLDNAAKWSPDAATVEVNLSGDGVLSVRDHGPGFSSEDLPHIFDRFYRAPAARSLPGSGLGLAVVKQVTDSHKATIRASNAADGGGLVEIFFTNS